MQFDAGVIGGSNDDGGCSIFIGGGVVERDCCCTLGLEEGIGRTFDCDVLATIR